MICRAVALCVLVACLIGRASAEDRVTVAITRNVGNAVLFLAAARGYFIAEGLTLEMRAYPDAPAAEAFAGGHADLGLMAFSPRAFALAGSGKINAIAGQVREKRGYEGNEVVASNAAYGRGLHGFADLANKRIALTELGRINHYQLGLIAQRQDFTLNTGILKPLHSVEAGAQAVAMDKVDVVILQPLSARELFLAGRTYPVGWCSNVVAKPLGAQFASAKTPTGRRVLVEKFLRAYRRGAADLRRPCSVRSLFTSTISTPRCWSPPPPSGAISIRTVRVRARHRWSWVSSISLDAAAHLELTNLAREIAWFKAQDLIDKRIDVQSVVDLTFIKSLPAGK